MSLHVQAHSKLISRTVGLFVHKNVYLKGDPFILELQVQYKDIKVHQKTYKGSIKRFHEFIHSIPLADKRNG